MQQLPEETDEKPSSSKAGYKNICEIERVYPPSGKMADEAGLYDHSLTLISF